MDEPLISVGIPTFNRAATLRRAAESVLGQSHGKLELLISDNASEDGTAELCAELLARDERVRYVRQPRNLGPTANFNTLFERMSGEFVMVLSDDDWLAGDYLERCLSELRARPELVLACGIARYLDGQRVVRDGRDIELTQEDPAARVLAYISDVDENGVFYGLMPRAVLRAAAPLRNVLGNDWLLAAAVAVQGQLTTLTETHLYRELGGTSADIPKLVRTLGLPRRHARVPHLIIARELIRDIAGRAAPYRELSPPRRALLGLRAAPRVIDWRSLAWHLTMPTFVRLRELPGGQSLWRAYERLTRALGAGRQGS
jgi:glycosyltransferase involved in cell wall biosynthesis